MTCRLTFPIVFLLTSCFSTVSSLLSMSHQSSSVSPPEGVSDWPASCAERFFLNGPREASTPSISTSGVAGTINGGGQEFSSRRLMAISIYPEDRLHLDSFVSSTRISGQVAPHPEWSARFTYSFFVNPADFHGEGRPDPLNPKTFVLPKVESDPNSREIVLSVLELPHAPRQSYVGRRSGVPFTAERLRPQSIVQSLSSQAFYAVPSVERISAAKPYAPGSKSPGSTACPPLIPRLPGAAFVQAFQRTNDPRRDMRLVTRSSFEPSCRWWRSWLTIHGRSEAAIWAALTCLPIS